MADQSTRTTTESNPVKSNPTRDWLVMTAVGVTSLLGSIDGSIVNVALPAIGRDLRSEVATTEWVTTIYVLMACGLLLTFGRIGDMRGYKPMYVLGIATFVASSALCGLAPNVAMLILFRAVQGVGGSMLISIGPGILTVTFPPSQRGRVLGLQALMVYVGGSLGPVLGGVLTDAFSWRAIFYVNVPIGLAALVLSAKFIPRAAPASQSERLDLPGAALFLAMCSLLLIALDQGHAYGWTSRYIVTMFAADLLLLAIFLLVESRTRSPLLDLSLFRAPAFSLSGVSMICNYIGFFTSIFLIPFYLIQGRGLSSSSAGLIVAVQSVLMALAAPVAGAISDRIGTPLAGDAGNGGAGSVDVYAFVCRPGIFTGVHCGRDGRFRAWRRMLCSAQHQHDDGLGSKAPSRHCRRRYGNLPLHWHDAGIRTLRCDLHDLYPHPHSGRVLQWNPNGLPRRVRCLLHWLHRIGRPQMIHSSRFAPNLPDLPRGRNLVAAHRTFAACMACKVSPSAQGSPTTMNRMGAS